MALLHLREKVDEKINRHSWITATDRMHCHTQTGLLHGNLQFCRLHPFSNRTTGTAHCQKRKKILVPQITAPSWLDTPAIHYRLAYHNAAQSYTYANSRWSSPRISLTQQIKQKIAADTHHLVIKDSSVAIVEYELHIEIEEFSQIFSTLSDSYVSIRFRASLVNHAHRLIAQKIFSTSHAAATADAAGAVDGFTIASNRLMNELVEWLNSAVDNF